MTRYFSEFEISPMSTLRIGLISSQNSSAVDGYSPKTIEQADQIFERLIVDRLLGSDVLYVAPYKTDMGYRTLVISYGNKRHVKRFVFGLYVNDETEIDVLVLKSEVDELWEVYKRYTDDTKDEEIFERWKRKMNPQYRFEIK